MAEGCRQGTNVPGCWGSRAFQALGPKVCTWDGLGSLKMVSEGISGNQTVSLTPPQLLPP